MGKAARHPLHASAKAFYPLEELNEQPGVALHHIWLQVWEGDQLVEEFDEEDVVLLAEPPAIQLQKSERGISLFNWFSLVNLDLISKTNLASFIYKCVCLIIYCKYIYLKFGSGLTRRVSWTRKRPRARVP